MVDRQRGGVFLVVGEGAERHLCAVVGGHVQHLQARRVFEEARRDAEHDPVLVAITVHGGDLTLAEGIVERIVELLRRDVQARGADPVDDQAGFEPVSLSAMEIRFK